MMKWVLRICEQKSRNVSDCEIVLSCMQICSEHACSIKDEWITGINKFVGLSLVFLEFLFTKFQCICLPQVLQNTQSEQALPVAAILSVPAQPPRTTCVVLEEYNEQIIWNTLLIFCDTSKQSAWYLNSVIQELMSQKSCRGAFWEKHFSSLPKA